jgi:hypothetical protein
MHLFAFIQAVTAAHACVQVLEFLVVTLFDLSPFGEGFKVKKLSSMHVASVVRSDATEAAPLKFGAYLHHSWSGHKFRQGLAARWGLVAVFCRVLGLLSS